MLDKWQQMLNDLKQQSRGIAILKWHKRKLEKLKQNKKELALPFPND